jgi:hypothetical protein
LLVEPFLSPNFFELAFCFLHAFQTNYSTQSHGRMPHYGRAASGAHHWNRVRHFPAPARSLDRMLNEQSRQKFRNEAISVRPMSPARLIIGFI